MDLKCNRIYKLYTKVAINDATDDIQTATKLLGGLILTLHSGVLHIFRLNYLANTTLTEALRLLFPK